MSQNLQELCCLIIEDLYGAFYASIFSHLLHAGRCNAGQVAQRARLPLRQVKTGLAALIQLRLIHYHTSSNGTTYQADPVSTYNVLRIGKLAELARIKYGDIASDIVTESCILGFSTITELQHRVETRLSGKQASVTDSNHPNGDLEKMSEHQERSIAETIDLLREDGFLINLRAAQFQSDYDAARDAEASLGAVSVPKGRKGQIELEFKIDHAKRERQSLQFEEHGVAHNKTVRHTDANGDSPAAKRRKHDMSSSSKHTNGTANESGVFENTVLVSVGYRNLVQNIRDNYITDIAKRALGERHSKVIKSALLQFATSERWNSSISDASLDIGRLRADMSRSTAVNGKPLNGLNGNMQHGIDGHDHEEQYTKAEVGQSLELFSESVFDFVSSDGQDDWSIDKGYLDAFVREREILRLIKDRLGAPALRVVRMLIHRGKLDEKTLQETGLMGAKELRQILANLKQNGFVDLQEVPREAQRQPNRTIFLWFHDQDRVSKLLLENLYKAMSRLMQRLKIERLKYSSTLEKVERNDVQGSEDQILSAAELKILRRHQRTERWILGEIARLDQSVALLRDL